MSPFQVMTWVSGKVLLHMDRWPSSDHVHWRSVGPWHQRL